MAGLFDFLLDYPGMALEPMTGPWTVVAGSFKFIAETQSLPRITDSYELRIEVPDTFPGELPRVLDVGNKIPRNGFFHINTDDSLCLGSPLRLLWNLSQKPTLVGFASMCLVPYLYAVSHKMRFGGRFVFNELGHGAPGVLRDYADMFSLKNAEQVISVLKALSVKKRQANKRDCPCGCGRRLGRCVFNDKLREFRKITGRAWYKRELLYLNR